MVNYKLTYFDARGLGEAARQLFVLADEKFDDNRLTIDEFQKLRAELPSGQVPVLSVDGFEISQSSAIFRYLARKFGFAGETLEESAIVDSIVDLFKDFLPSFRQLSSGIYFGEKSAEEIDKIRKEIVVPASEKYFGTLNKYLETSKTGFLAGNGLTFADLVVADNLTTLVNLEAFDAEKQPKLASFHRKILETPKLKEYFEKRPFSVV